MLIEASEKEIDDMLDMVKASGVGIPEFVPERLLGEFLVLRRKVHKKKVRTTARAVRIIVRKLQQYHDIGWPAETVLEQAMEGEWQTVHLPQGEPPKRQLNTVNRRIQNQVKELAEQKAMPRARGFDQQHADRVRQQGEDALAGISDILGGFKE